MTDERVSKLSAGARQGMLTSGVVVLELIAEIDRLKAQLAEAKWLIDNALPDLEGEEEKTWWRHKQAWLKEVEGD